MLKMPDDFYGTAPALKADAAPADVETTQSIIEAMYESICGPAGQPRRWNRIRSLCLPQACFIRVGKLPEGTLGCKVMRTPEYIEQMEPWLLANGFYEKEVHRVEERFGNIAQVFSTYESRRSADDPEPFMRGVNSFQLMHDGRRWWIVNVMWQHESPENPLPPEYL